MAKASQSDPDQGTVNSAPTAAQVAEIARLVPMVLLREDPRVREAYVAWHPHSMLEELEHRVVLMERLHEIWDLWSPTPGTVQEDPHIGGLHAELHTLDTLTKALGLGRYRWLPLRLWYAFAAEALGQPVLQLSFPDGVPQASAGKRPKRSGPKGYRREDLERHVTWWYRCDVAGVTTSAIAKETGYPEPDVAEAVQRVRTVLPCIDAPHPVKHLGSSS